MTITVRHGNETFTIPAFRGSDGLTVADPRGVRAAREVWRQTRGAVAERNNPPKGYSPFRDYRRSASA